MRTAIQVDCQGNGHDGWTCSVTLQDDDGELSHHRVQVSPADLERLAPGADDPTALVEASFEFLLEREPPGSILRTFDLPDIARYFPEYVREITCRSR